jgi:hypothetical protein
MIEKQKGTEKGNLSNGRKNLSRKVNSRNSEAKPQTQENRDQELDVKSEKEPVVYKYRIIFILNIIF